MWILRKEGDVEGITMDGRKIEIDFEVEEGHGK
jgi:hypothetical protein